MENFNAHGNPTTERNWALTAHLVPLAAMWFSAGFLGFIGGIVVYAMAKDKGPLARNYAAQALNIQITAFIWLAVSVALMLVLIGFVLFPLVLVIATVYHVVALLKASQDEVWSPPFVFKFVR